MSSSPANSKSNRIEDFLAGFLQGSTTSGRPVHAIAGPDGALYVTDDMNGVVYRISYNSPPVTPSLSISPRSLSFSFQIGSAAPASQSVSIISTGAPVSFSAAAATASGSGWLQAGPGAGTTPATLTVGLNPAGLAPSSYVGSVTITSSGASNSPQNIAVTLTVTAPITPTIAAAPSSLSFNQIVGGSAPSAQVVSVSSYGAALSFSASASTNNGGSWLSVSAGAGNTPATLTVTVNPAGLVAGSYAGSITITSSGATNSQQTIPVSLTVTAPVITAIVVTPSSFSFNQIVGGPAPLAQTASVSSSAGALSFSASSSTNNGGSWLAVSPGAGTTPSVLTVSVNGSGLVPGTYSGSIAIRAQGASNSPQSIGVTLAIAPGAAPAPAIAAVMNAATFLPTSVAPGQIITIFGTGIGPTAPVQMRINPGGLVDGNLAGARVLFDGVAAPMIYASSTLVSAIVPYTVAGRSTTRLQIEFQGTASAGLDLPVVAAAPGIFTMSQSGRGQGAILNESYSVNSATNRAAKGSVVMIYATGEGQTNPPGVDGLITDSVLRTPLQPVSVTIGGQQAEVLYSGSAPGLVSGVLQVNARVPQGIASGDAVPVVLTVGSVSSAPGVTMALQ